MAHMVPQYHDCTTDGPMYDYDGECGPEPDDCNAMPCTVHRSGIFYRLSAPGYLDCTEWSGPFATLDDARADCTATFDCDPDTGNPLPDDVLDEGDNFTGSPDGTPKGQ